MMILTPAGERYRCDYGWLQSYHLFSFGDYFDPKNLHWGQLRVYNDDLIAPHTGFDTHFHKEMEIVTIVLQGAVTHEDSTGNKKRITAKMVQRMSAGTGVQHSEYNHEDNPLHLHQIWILPNEAGLAPEYEEASFENAIQENGLTHLVGKGGPLSIHADAHIYYGHFEKGKTFRYEFSEDRAVFLYLRLGGLRLGEILVRQKDQIRVLEESFLEGEVLEESEFVLIDTPLHS